MTMDDKDWLDARLATYVPDNGFAARVAAELPRQRTRVATARQRILLATSVLAFALLAVQIVSLTRDLAAFLTRHSPEQIATALIRATAQPAVLPAVAAGVIVLSCASIPLLRRWA